MKETMKLIDTTNFVDRGEVVFEVSGKVYRRRVYWDGYGKDLYFRFRNIKYYYGYDFNDEEGNIMSLDEIEVL